MIVATVAPVLGRAQREGRGWRSYCPLHGGHSFVVRGGRGWRLLVRSWGGGCDPRDVLAELQRRELIVGGDEDFYATASLPSEDRDNATRRIAWARRIWDRAKDVRGSPAPSGSTSSLSIFGNE